MFRLAINEMKRKVRIFDENTDSINTNTDYIGHNKQ